MNVDDVIIIASEVHIDIETKPLPIPRKMKGKKMGYNEFAEMKRNFIQSSLESNKYPFWQVRY